MPNCASFEHLLERRVSGEADSDEQRRLDEHLLGCEACSGLLELHQRLEQWEFAPEEPDAPDLGAMRRAVLRQAREEGTGGSRWFGPRPWLTQLAAGFLLLFVGFFFGTLGGATTEDEPRRGHPLDLELQRLASAQGQLDPASSTYAVSNLHMRPLDGGTVALSFDLATRMEFSRQAEDPLVDELLAQSILNTEPLGQRLEALSYAEGRLDARVRDALIEVVLNDPSLPVRLSALDRLTSYPAEAAVEQALLQVLTDEDSTQMRLLAIDSLTRRHVAPQKLEEAIQGARPDVAQALKVRAGEYIRSL